jgi:hypothetical protein
MMLEPEELRELIQKTLQPINLWSPSAEELLMATCANESLLGGYRRQVGGPALGIFQMEPEDFNDIFKNYLAYHPSLLTDVCALASTQPPRPVELVTNDAFAVLLARIHYLRQPGMLPPPNDIEAIWRYYKLFFNTPGGAATHDAFVTNYKKLVGGPP